MFCTSTTVRTGMCIALKEWHLLSIGNSFYRGLGREEVISFDLILERGDQTFVTKCGKRVGGQCYAEIV